MKKLKEKISERAVEDALVSNLFYLKKLLNFSLDVKLIARQLPLKQAEQRLDILLAHGRELCLIELKVTKFKEEYIQQVSEYREELIKLQKEGKLIEAHLRSFLMVTGFDPKDKEFCDLNNIEMVQYQPIEVLSNYFQNLSEIATFLKIKPKDYGVFSLGLIHRTLKVLSTGVAKQAEIAKITRLSGGSVHNHLIISKEFGLIRERNKQYFLTDFGDEYIASAYEKEVSGNILAFEQSEMLKKFIAEDPFYSSTAFGIYSIVESAFALSRNRYPIDFKELVKIFTVISGNTSAWRAKKSQNTATYTFLNYAIDLGLLGKIGQQVVITPAGFRFILMLQLHKSIEMIKSLSPEQKSGG